MILPHYYCKYQSGEIQLNNEYSEYKWFTMEDLSTEANVLSNIREICTTLTNLAAIASSTDFIDFEPQ